MPAVPAIPTQENSSAGKTFSMSRWAMMLPIVARRSPAMMTPPGKVAATIVVPCGARSAALPSGSERRLGSRSGACSARKSENDEEPGARNAGPSRLSRASLNVYSPPFWMNDLTKSSPFVSSTSSISSRMASMSSSSCSLRSATSLCPAASACSSVSEVFFGCLCSCAIRSSWVRVSTGSTSATSSTSAASDRAATAFPQTLPSQGREQGLRGVTTVQQFADVGPAAPHRVDGGDALQRLAPRQVEDHRVPRGGRDLVAVLLQAPAAEVGAGVDRRLVDGAGHLLVREQPVDAVEPQQPVVEPLVRADVGVLQVDGVQLRVGPLQAVAVAVLLQQPQLRDPVQLPRAEHRVPLQPVQDGLPPGQDVEGLRVGGGPEPILDVLLGQVEVLHLQLYGGQPAPVGHGE